MPYRDDHAALESRRDELRQELADATRRADALTDVVAEKERIARELASVERRIARNGTRRLPLLERTVIASPCSASWDDMVGDDRVRFCGSCEKNVYNIAAMVAAEAERLLVEHEGNVCVRLYRRADGTVLTADCPVGVRRKRVKRAIAAVAGASAMAASASALFTPRPIVATTGMMTAPMGAPTVMPMGTAAIVPTMGSAEIPPVPVTGKAVMGGPSVAATGEPAKAPKALPTMGRPSMPRPR
jgi:hypothetical protein